VQEPTIDESKGTSPDIQRPSIQEPTIVESLDTSPNMQIPSVQLPTVAESIIGSPVMQMPSTHGVDGNALTTIQNKLNINITKKNKKLLFIFRQ